MRDPAMEIAIFSTCPASAGLEPAVFRRRVVEVARWSERQRCRGILVYTDNSLLDPWLVAGLIVESTASLVPLVAVQPAYMHPYTVAKMVTSFGALPARALRHDAARSPLRPPPGIHDDHQASARWTDGDLQGGLLPGGAVTAGPTARARAHALDLDIGVVAGGPRRRPRARRRPRPVPDRYRRHHRRGRSRCRHAGRPRRDRGPRRR